MARGGYRKPSNPAPVSGPGKLSRRTDGGAGSKQAMKEIRTGKYGESKALMEQQQGAPLAGNPAPNPQVKAPVNPVTPLFAPTQRPTEPVTEGMPFGPGGTTPPTAEFKSPAMKYMSTLEALAVQDDAPASFKAFVRALKAKASQGVIQ